MGKTRPPDGSGRGGSYLFTKVLEMHTKAVRRAVRVILKGADFE